MKNNDESNLNYSLICDTYANSKNVLNIWIKFVNHITDEEVETLKNYINKGIENLTPNELEEFLKIKKQIEVSKLFIKYSNKNCTKEEHDLVYDFMKQSLTKFVASRVSKEQQKISSNYVEKLLKENTIEEYINEREKVYTDLDINEAYTLFIAKEALYNKTTTEDMEKSQLESKLREQNLRRKLIRDYGIF